MLDSILAKPTGPTDTYAGKSLAERLAGRFYTPDVLAADLARRLADELEVRMARGRLGQEIQACDPFCGDGRLIIALLAEAASRPTLRQHQWVVTLQDLEAAAARGAGKAVAASIGQLGLDASVRVIVGDSLATGAPDRHDVVVTNPPWELLKPDARELAHLPAAERAAHRDRLRALCDGLDARFPEARASRAWAGWGTNLARCGWELSLRSCVPGGALGIVLPSTILGDQTSVDMRRSALRRSRLVDLAAYPPEARLFARVDQPVVAATFVAEATSGVEATLRLFNADRELRLSRRLSVSEADLETSSYALPVGFGTEVADLLASLSALPRLADLEGSGPASLWAGRELDETRIAERIEEGLRHPFIKGRMVQRHTIAEMPTRSVLPMIARGLRSTAFERIVWRDVARASQKRRMISTIIPPGWVAGNSLHVAYFRDGDPKRLRALHAVMSSFVLELQVRSRLATGHMSLGVVREARLPVMNQPVLARLAAEADAVLSKAGDKAAVSLEVAVAQAYGLDRSAMTAILELFVKVDAAEREAILAPALWSKRSRR